MIPPERPSTPAQGGQLPPPEGPGSHTDRCPSDSGYLRPEVLSDNASQPDLPRFIPTARPVLMARTGATYPFLSEVPLARPAIPVAPVARGPWRALFELIMLVPAGFFGQIVGYVVVRSAGVTDEQWLTIASTIGMGTGCVAAVLLFLFINGERGADIGWRSENVAADVGIGIAALLTTYMLALSLLMTIALFAPSILEESETARRAVDELMPDMTVFQMALLMAFVAIWEEVVFRGFLLTRLKSLLRSWWLAVPLSSVLFGAVHLYEGLLAVGMVTLLGLVMAGLFIWRRSLLPCIVMHFLNNFTMLLLLEMDW